MGRVRLVVEDRDRSAASAELVKAIGEADGLRLELVEGDDAGTAREHVADGEAPAGLLIEPGFGESLDAEEGSGLVLYRDPAKAIEQQIVAGNLVPALFSAVGERLAERAMKRSLEVLDFPLAGRVAAASILEDSWDRMYELIDALESDATPEGTAEAEAPDEDAADFDFASAVGEMFGLDVEDVVGGTAEAEAQKAGQQAHAVSGIAVMMLLFGLVACGGTLLEEQADGTLDRLRLAPGTLRDILAGKFLFTWIIGMAQLVILFLVTRLIFPIPVFRAPVALLVLSAVVACAATGFGIVFAAVCRTRKQLEGLSTIVILTMSAMGGSWWPLIATPEWYQFLGHFTLNAWAMDGYQALFWYEKGLGDIWLEIGVLLGIGVTTSAIALIVWTRRLRTA